MDARVFKNIMNSIDGYTNKNMCKVVFVTSSRNEYSANASEFVRPICYDMYRNGYVGLKFDGEDAFIPIENIDMILLKRVR